jgi:hypothetical protein
MAFLIDHVAYSLFLVMKLDHHPSHNSSNYQTLIQDLICVRSFSLLPTIPTIKYPIELNHNHKAS